MENKRKTKEISQAPEYEKYMTEYERGLLSLAFRNPKVLTQLQQSISADYFLYPPNKLIYTALSNLLSNSSIKKIDSDSLIIECNNLGLQSLGVSADYVLIISEGGFDLENFSFYLDNVRTSYVKYQFSKILKQSASNLEKSLKDASHAANAEDLIHELNTSLSELTAFKGSDDPGISFSSRVEEFVIEASAEPTDVRGLRTGIPSLDIAINGLMPGTLTIVAARMKGGKSTLLLNITDYIAIEALVQARKAGIRDDPTVPVLYINTEMGTDEDLGRALALRTLIEERKIINGIAYNDPKLKPIIDRAIKQIKKSKIYHVYLPDFDASKVVSIINYYKTKYNIGLAVFDYIKLDTVAGSLERRREDQVLGDLTTALKQTAGKLEIPILSACQLGRGGDVADSDRLRRYCNTLIEFNPKTTEELAEQDFHRHGTHWLDITTARSGGNGKIPIRFWKRCLKIEEAEAFEGGEENGPDPGELLTTPADFELLKQEEFKIEKLNRITESSGEGDPFGPSYSGADDGPI